MGDGLGEGLPRGQSGLQMPSTGLLEACPVVQQTRVPVQCVMWVLRGFKDTSPHLSQLCPLLK